MSIEKELFIYLNNNKKTLIVLLVLICLYCFCNNWLYYFFDILVKFISGVGAIAAGIFVYIRWQDEKTRNLYERSLQIVYAPLMGVLLRQEEYRRIELPNSSWQVAPILTAKVTIKHTTLENGMIFKTYTEKKDGLVSNKQFLSVLNKEAYGLMSPVLLKCIKGYSLLVAMEEKKKDDIEESTQNFLKDEHEYNKVMQTADGKKLQIIVARKFEIAGELVREIVARYNECVEKLGMYKEKVDFMD